MKKIDDILNEYGKSIRETGTPADFEKLVLKTARSKIAPQRPVKSDEKKPIVRILQYAAAALVAIALFVSMFYFFPHDKTRFAGSSMKQVTNSLSPIPSPTLSPSPSFSPSPAPTFQRDRSQSIFTYNTIFYFLGEIDWGFISGPKQIFDGSDLVLIVTPTSDYMDTTPLAPFNLQYVKGEDQFAQYSTMRNLDVIQVLKGENVPANLNVGESFGFNNELSSEGKPQLLLLYDCVIPMRAGMKYVVFLSYDSYKNRYGLHALQGKFNIDGKDTDEKNISLQNWSAFQDFKYRTLDFISSMTTIPIVNNGVPAPTPTPQVYLSDLEKFLAQFDTAMYFYGPVDATPYNDFTKEQDFAYFMRALDRNKPNFDRLNVIVYFKENASSFNDSKYLLMGYTVKAATDNDLAGLNAYIVTIPDRHTDPAWNVGDAAREIYADENVARMKPILSAGTYR